MIFKERYDELVSNYPLINYKLASLGFIGTTPVILGVYPCGNKTEFNGQYDAHPHNLIVFPCYGDNKNQLVTIPKNKYVSFYVDLLNNEEIISLARALLEKGTYVDDNTNIRVLRNKIVEFSQHYQGIVRVSIDDVKQEIMYKLEKFEDAREGLYEVLKDFIANGKLIYVYRCNSYSFDDVSAEIFPLYQ